MLSPNSSDYDSILPSPSSAMVPTPSPIRQTTVHASVDPAVPPAHSAQDPSPSKEASSLGVASYCSPWLARLAYPLARYVLLPFYFKRIEVTGRENFPTSGAVILAPTHRSRWDAFMVPYAVGQDVTGRTLRFMVSADEVTGIQGWFIRRLGGFPINTKQPAIAALRHSVELLQQGEALVIFPEGNIYRECKPLKPGLARLALQAEASHAQLNTQIVPIHIQYSKPLVPWRCSVTIKVGQPIAVANSCCETPKLAAKRLTAELETTFKALGDRSNSID